MNTQTQIRLLAAMGCTIAIAWAPVAARAEVAGGVIGCDAPGGKQEGGALIGAVLGGLAGNSLAKHERGAGTIIGATAGAAAGSYVGCRMQKSDAAKPAAEPDRHAAAEAEDPAYDDGSANAHDRRFTPPGLAKKPYGLPPGQARKYAVGQRLPGAFVHEPRYSLAEPERYRLRYPPAGYHWVMVDRDAYLVRDRTGVIADVARAVLG